MQQDWVDLISPSPGVHRRLAVWRLQPEKLATAPATRPRTVYLQAGLHADEWPGLLVIQHLLGYLREAEQLGAIRSHFTVVPYANPIGMSQNVFGYVTGRFDAAGTGNFNRNFPDLLALASRFIDKMEDRPSESAFDEVREFIREALAAHRVKDETSALKLALLSLSWGADLVLDLHCDDRTTAHIYAAEIQADSARALAASLGFPYVFLEDLNGTVAFDGSHLFIWKMLTERFPQRFTHIPVEAYTLEYRGQHDVEDVLAREDARRLLRWLIETGHIDAAAKDVLSDTPGDQAAQDARERPDAAGVSVPFVTPLSALDTVQAPCAGLLVFHVGLDSEVSEGQIFAEIVQIDGDEPNQRTAVRAATSGRIMGLSHRRLVRPGDQVAKIAGSRPLEYRLAGELLQL